jgi:simple sugar transport system permease protein
VDLSVGSVMAIAATVAAVGARELGPGASAAAALGAGARAGTVNGVLVAALRLQPIVATLILYTAGRGIAQLASGGTVVPLEAAHLGRLAGAAWLGLPASAWVALGALGALGLAVRRTAYGLYLEALGDNPRAARVAGLPVAAVLVGSYAACAGLAAVAGLLVAADIRAADPSSTGLYVELDAILAVVIGGTPLRGGRVRLVGSALGALTLQTLTTAVLMHGARLDLALVVKALAVLAVVAAQSPRWRELLPRREEARA